MPRLLTIIHTVPFPVPALTVNSFKPVYHARRPSHGRSTPFPGFVGYLTVEDHTDTGYLRRLGGLTTQWDRTTPLHERPNYQRKLQLPSSSALVMPLDPLCFAAAPLDPLVHGRISTTLDC